MEKSIKKYRVTVQLILEEGKTYGETIYDQVVKVENEEILVDIIKAVNNL